MKNQITLDYLSKREIDENGFWTISDNPIARVGVMLYGKNELPYFEGIEELPEDAVLKVLKSEEGFSQEYLDSLKGKPILVEHEWLSEENKDLSETFTAGSIGDDVYLKNGIVYANIYINSKKAQEIINEGCQELSVGSTTQVFPQNGTYEGEGYDYVMKHQIANHVSIVENGRCGSSVKVLDTGEKTMAKKEKMLDKLINMLKTGTMDEEKKTEDESDLEAIESRLDGFEDKDVIISLIKEMIKKTEHIVEDEEEKIEDEEDEEEKEEKKTEDEEAFSEAQMRAIEAIIEKVLASTNDELEKKVMDSMQSAVVDGNRLRGALAPHIGAVPQEFVTVNSIVEYASKKLGTAPTLDSIQGYIQGKGSSIKTLDSASLRPKNSKYADKITAKRGF